MSENAKRQPISEFELARQIRELDLEMQPSRDLWMGIERQIVDHPQKLKKPGSLTWMPYAVAASLVIAVSSLMFNLTLLQNQNQGLQQTTALGQVQQEYIQVRNPMYEEFTKTNAFLDERTKNDLYQNLEILEQARTELERQVQENPDDQALMQMLIRVHQQELELLRQDFSRASRSM